MCFSGTSCNLSEERRGKPLFPDDSCSTPLCQFSLPIHRTLQAHSLPPTASLEQGKLLHTAQKHSLKPSPCWKWVLESGCSPRHAEMVFAFDLTFSISRVGLLWSAKRTWRPVPWLYCLLPVLSMSLKILDTFMSVSDPTSPQPSSPVKTEARESETGWHTNPTFLSGHCSMIWLLVSGSGSLSYLVYTSPWNCISSIKLLPDLVQRRLVAVKYRKYKFNLVLHWWNWESEGALN